MGPYCGHYESPYEESGRPWQVQDGLWPARGNRQPLVCCTDAPNRRRPAQPKEILDSHVRVMRLEVWMRAGHQTSVTSRRVLGAVCARAGCHRRG